MLVTDQSTLAAVVTDASGNITGWNSGCTELFGLDAESVMQTPLTRLLTEAGQQAYAARWPAMPTRCEAQPLQIRCAHGQVGDAHLVLIPQHDPDGAVNRLVAFFSAEVNVSDRDAIGRIPLRAIIDTLPGTFYIVRPNGTFVLWNKALETFTGFDTDELAATNAYDMYNPAEKLIVGEKVRQVFEEGQAVFAEVDVYGKDGKVVPFLLCGSRIEYHGRRYLCGMGLDVTARREQDRQLRLRERALHAASNGIVITRCEGDDNPIEYVNPAFERITGYRADEAIGRDSRFMAAAGLDDEERAQLRLAIRERREHSVTMRNQRKDGELFWNHLTITPVSGSGGPVTHFIGVINDVTAVKQRTAHLEHEVNHDALTGLANRTLLWDRLEQAIHMAQRNKSLVATVLLDLNRFKQINDTLGHEAGDQVLVVVARRLQASVRESDTVARLSGDEFVLVLVNQPSLRYTLRMIERLRQAIAKPVVFNGAEIAVGASMGVSVFPHDGASAFDLVRAADVAMYHAKNARATDVHFFSPDMKSATEAKQKFEDSMRRAVENDELFLLFQPKISLQSGRIVGFEALLRWRHPEQGLLLPASFLPEAEENGMIIPFGDFALEQACAFLQRLTHLGFRDMQVAVNVAQREYSRQNYVQHVADVLSQFGIAPSSLDIELREEGLIRDHHLGRDVMAQLSELGVLRSVDAFGDGLSDLNYLATLPLTHLKLAKVAVHQISPETRTGPMAKSLIDIGHNLNLKVIAECVETRAQMDFLKSNNCDEMQGLYFKEPISADQVEQLLASPAAA